MRVRAGATWCGVLVLLGVFTVPTGAASPLDKRTTVTVSTPFAVPGVTLPAGTYVFRLAVHVRGHDVVQVLSATDGTALATFFTLRTARGAPVDKPQILFMETAEEEPPAVRSWWYPAETSGYEFVYAPGRSASVRLPTTCFGERRVPSCR